MLASMTGAPPADDSAANDSTSDSLPTRAELDELVRPSDSAGLPPFQAQPVLLPPITPRKAGRTGFLSEPSLFDRIWLPAFLLVATCLSTFFAGAMSWQHEWLLDAAMTGRLDADAFMGIRAAILRHAGQGIIYMLCVVGILFAHEMGHYIATRIYKVPASYPYFIPFLIAPIGTMGAVIAMQSQKANRKEIFDIGIAGPLAGLVLAIPIVYVGVSNLDLSTPSTGSMPFDMPLLVRWMYVWLHPDAGPLPPHLYASQMNPVFMAGWVGLLITGLNMLPVSQLDGGHVTYTLFGKYSRMIARIFIGLAILYMVLNKIVVWTVMLLLIFAIGIDHPPTSDDSVPLGKGRMILGALSLLIPVLCFPPRGLGF